MYINNNPNLAMKKIITCVANGDRTEITN